jgi:hypothetical protein
MKRSVFLSLFLCTVVLGQPTISDEAIWKDFTTWLQKQTPNSKPGEMIRAYRENLIRQRIATDEASRRMGVVSNFIFARHKGVEVLWDKVFAGTNPIWVWLLWNDAPKGGV